ncbi:hypothetical protein QFZ75_001680 [Streptomyces sp. V3I8]|nr:hypothetical protein [Streptomyces sp. V3I8]
MQDLLDEWILAAWHRRLQDQLRHPLQGRASPAARRRCGKSVHDAMVRWRGRSTWDC